MHGILPAISGLVVLWGWTCDQTCGRMDRDLRGEGAWLHQIGLALTFQSVNGGFDCLTQVVAQPCYLHAKNVPEWDEKTRLPLAQRPNKLSGQVAHPGKNRQENNRQDNWIWIMTRNCRCWYHEHTRCCVQSGCGRLRGRQSRSRLAAWCFAISGTGVCRWSWWEEGVVQCDHGRGR